MNKIKRAKEIYQRNGVMSLVQRTGKFIRSRFRRFRKGGLSSRPRIQPVAGFVHPIINWYFEQQYGQGIDIIGEDWDTLILLDACRYDDFNKINYLPGDLESRISRGQDSRKFILRNFADRTMYDTVYVTANPHVSLIDGSTFHAIIDDPISEWDPDIKCVRPNVVTKAALEAHNEFPDKRIIVHYMQPHDPPLGPTADRLRNDMKLAGPVPGGGETEGMRLLPAVARGQVQVETARKAYRETLNIALQEVKNIIKNTEGKVVISSDHGEMFGEKPYPILGKLYEHYDHPKTIELCKVPWFVANESKNRRDVRSEPPRPKTDVDQSKIEEQLEALGYK